MYLFIFQILLLFPQLLYGVTPTATLDPPAVCIGDSVTVNCTFTAGVGEMLNPRTCFVFGEFPNESVDVVSVNGGGSFHEIYLGDFNATAPSGNSNYVIGSITLKSYSDKYINLSMGCYINYTLSGDSKDYSEKYLLLKQAELPSISTPIPTIQNLNPSTCGGTLRFNLAATSDRDITSYSILFNGSIIALNLPSSDTEFIYNTQFLLNTNYPTSIIATSCAGNSNDGDASVRVNDYMQLELNCTRYNSMTGELTINWDLNTPSQPTGVSGINIAYSVRVTYSHSNGTDTYLFTDTSNFNLISTVTTYDVPLTPHNFTNPQGVETNITAHVRILQQCGQDLVGTELSCSLTSRSGNPINPNSTQTTQTTSTATSIPNTGGNPQLIIYVITGLVSTILIIIGCAVFVAVILFVARKRKHSPLNSSKPDSFRYSSINPDQISIVSSRSNQRTPAIDKLAKTFFL